VNARVREAAKAAGEAAYRDAAAAGKTGKQLRYRVLDGIEDGAQKAAVMEAEQFARKQGLQAVREGKAFGAIDKQAKTRLAEIEGGVRVVGQDLQRELLGKTEKEFLDTMAKEVAEGRVQAPRTLKIAGPPPQDMQMWEYKDGTVVRFKPLGDARRPSPTFSVEVKKDPSLPDNGLDTSAFKLDRNGRPTPRDAEDILNPYSPATNRVQHDAFRDAILADSHFSLNK
jgi:hypothetical protein